MKIKNIIFAGLFMMLFGCIFSNKLAEAKIHTLQPGKTNHVEIKHRHEENDDYDDIACDELRIPSSYCYFTIKIKNIRIIFDGQYHDEYVEYVKVDDFYDTDKEYFFYKDSIVFKKTGNTVLAEDRKFHLEIDDDKLFDNDEMEMYENIERKNYSIICDITVTANATTKLSKTNLTCYLDDYEGKELKLKYAPGSVKWFTSNKKIASIVQDENLAFIIPKKIGTCYIKAQSGGKLYKCKVKVKGRKHLYAGGILESYNTRSNIFTMKFKNCSNSTIKITSSGARAVDSDYKSFDRNLKLTKTVSIKPGKTKRLKFKVLGGNTWYNANDFCIYYTVIYKGKNYRMASDTENTWTKQKGKWKKLLTYDMIGRY